MHFKPFQSSFLNVCRNKKPHTIHTYKYTFFMELSKYNTFLNDEATLNECLYQLKLCQLSFASNNLIGKSKGRLQSMAVTSKRVDLDVREQWCIRTADFLMMRKSFHTPCTIFQHNHFVQFLECKIPILIPGRLMEGAAFQRKYLGIPCY